MIVSQTKRKKIIAGNWKMYKLQADLPSYFEELSKHLESSRISTNTSVCICVPFLLLEEALACADQWKLDYPLDIAAQNVCDALEGAYTGEISWPMLREIGIGVTLIGHSERRQYFQENHDLIRRKVNRTKELGCRAILCVGESKADRENSRTELVLKEQLSEALKDCKDLKNLVIAYEPVWAIGTGLVATTQQAQSAHAFIRLWIKENFSEMDSQSIQILYGGSVKPDNAKDLLSQPDIDGALVGGASLKAKDFAEIILAG